MVEAKNPIMTKRFFTPLRYVQNDIFMAMTELLFLPLLMYPCQGCREIGSRYLMPDTL